MTSAQLFLCSAMTFLVIHAATATHSHCGCYKTQLQPRPSLPGGYGSCCCSGYGSGYGSGYSSGYGIGYGSGYGSDSGSGYGCGCSKVVKLPIIKKTTVVRQPFVHETRQAVVTVHGPSIKNTHAQQPQVSSYVQKSCKCYVENGSPVVVPHPVIPTPTCDDNEGSYSAGSDSASAPVSYPATSDISNSTPEVYSTPSSSYQGYSSYAPCSRCGHGHKGSCGCLY